MVQTILFPKLDFFSSILWNLPISEINRLQKLHNNSIRFIFKLKKREHLTEYYKQLKLLKMDKIPFPAAISTTVEVAKKTDLNGLAGTVNAILRNASRKLEQR